MNLYKKIYNNDEVKIKILGIVIYKKYCVGNLTKKVYWGGLFKKKYAKNEKKYYLFGIKVLQKSIPISIKDLERVSIQTIRGFQRSIKTALLHQKTFSEFKNKHQNQTIVLVGAGPTLNHFKTFKNAFYVGCNRAFKKKDILFDYLFTIDKAGLDTGSEQYYDDFLNYQPDTCVKFIGDQNSGIDYQIPESFILKFPLDKVRRYKTTSGYLPNNFELDIDCMPLANGASVTIQAMQFIMYTNPQKIYIVGVDCTVASNQHFTGSSYDNSQRGSSSVACDDYNVSMWKLIKDFAATYYPETEIISVNPVRLRGLFKDVYTKSYLDANPQVKQELKDDIISLEDTEKCLVNVE